MRKRAGSDEEEGGGGGGGDGKERDFDEKGLPSHLSSSFFIGLSSSSFQQIVEYLIHAASLNEKQVESVGDRIIRAIRDCSNILLKKYGSGGGGGGNADNEDNPASNIFSPSPSLALTPSLTPTVSANISVLPSSLRLLSLALMLLPWGDRSSRPFTTAMGHPVLFYSIAQTDIVVARNLRLAAVKVKRVIRYEWISDRDVVCVCMRISSVILFYFFLFIIF
jgi:hypothetical protein